MSYPDEQVKSIMVGEDKSWSSGVRRMLEQIDSSYIIVFLEDFLIKEPVDTSKVVSIVQAAITNSVGCLRLAAGLPLAFPLTEKLQNFPGLGIIGKEQHYRVSAQVAIWKKDTLLKLLPQGISPWEFEDVGTELSTMMEDSFWGVYEPAIIYDQFVEKGKWKPEGVELCKSLGVDIDFARRDHFTLDQWRKYCFDQTTAAKVATHKKNAVDCFSRGNIVDGMSHLHCYVRMSHNLINACLLFVIGLSGAKATQFLQKINRKYKLFSIRRRN